MNEPKTEAINDTRQPGLAPATCYAAPCESCGKTSDWKVTRYGMHPCVLNYCDDCLSKVSGMLKLVAYPDDVKITRHNAPAEPSRTDDAQ